MRSTNKLEKVTFTPYQIFIIAIIATLQFTVVLDFMVLSPLSAILLDQLHIGTSEFGLVVSAYAFSAGASGILAAGFADKFDRKKILMFFYSGFVLGTVLCAMATTYQFLMMARIVTGIFGGVISSISFAIITDMFKMEVRGRVMGFVQMAFAASQILGLPIGLYLANRYGWHSPFWMIAIFAAVLGVVIILYMKPIDEHLKVKSDRHPFMHLWKTISHPPYLRAFLATAFLATGGYMLMPFGAAFSTNNLKLSVASLPLLYGITGLFSIVFGPLSGKLSDKVGKLKVFIGGSVISGIMVLIYTQLGPTPLWVVIFLNVLLFLGITSRMISSSALITGVPMPHDRGAFMSINSSIQQISGGIAAGLAGLIVVRSDNGILLHYPVLGYVVILSMLIVVWLMYRLNNQVAKKENQSSEKL